MLGVDERRAVAGLFVRALRDSRFRGSLPLESEPSYTSLVVQPCLLEVWRRLEIPGLVVGGHGGAPAHAVSFMGLQFIPDAEITYRGSRLLAIETKFIRPANRQHQITVAIGQATIYSLAGFDSSVALLLDFATTTYLADKPQVSELGQGRVSLVVKRRNHLGEFVSQQ